MGSAVMNKKVTAVSILWNNKTVPIEKQKQEINRYAEQNNYNIIGEYTVKYWWENNTYLAVIALLARLRPRAVLVYLYATLGYSCRRMTRNISGILSIAEEIAEAYSGEKITRTEWRRALPTLCKLTRTPVYKRRTIDPSLVMQVMDLLPLSLEEARLIYNTLAEKKALAPVKDIRSGLLPRVVAEESLTAETMGNRNPDPILLPKKIRDALGGEDEKKRGEQREENE